MTQRIYDSRVSDTVEFQPLTPGQVGIYVCGPTVQSSPHIGHLRSALVFDQMRRWFLHSGMSVTLIRNVTDIDDKILERAEAARGEGSDEAWWALAYRVEREFTAAYDALGILPPTYEPRATAHITSMIELIQQLIARGHAYQARDGSASVYFDTHSWPDYGELTRQQLTQMESAEDADLSQKKNPQDFALWKAHRDHEPESAAWASPWGHGRPGWHIECSAMSTTYLGEAFDIHGGGLDLRFPHHENELAQSRAAGHDFARYWMHNGLVHVSGQKMSKSLGNSLFAHALLSDARPIVVRYFLGSAHYRSVLEFHDTALAEADAAMTRIETFVARADRELGALPSEAARVVPHEFADAMNDDFAIPQALAVLHDAVRAGNVALDTADTVAARDAQSAVISMLDVLGLNPSDTVWADGGESERDVALAALVEALIEQRNAARRDKDFATSDAIRDRLLAAGITLEDAPNATHWSINAR